MSELITLSAVSTIEAVSTMGEVSSMSAVPVISTVSTMGAFSILEFEIFEGIPLWLLFLSLSALLVFMLFIMMISWIFNAEKEAKKKAHHEPTPHEVMVELQKELLKSMESTSKQNRLMIWLTILFIIVSVLGGAVVINFFQNIKDYGATWVAQFFAYISSILTK